MKLAQIDRRKLLALLDELGGAVEELLLGGLTTASQATQQALNVAFQEASRFGLLRLGSTLRAANEELGRYVRQVPEFSRKRLFFFLNRAWLLGHGLARAARDNDQAAWERILFSNVSQPVDRLDVVALGVSKKASSAFCAFEFRLRAVDDGRPLLWSCVFPVKPGSDLPAEAYLQLPQKQKFVGAVFLDRKAVVIEKAAVSVDAAGVGRIALNDQSTVVAGEPFTEWTRFMSWHPGTAAERIRAHQPGPLDLEVELQEEIVLADYEIGDSFERDEAGPTVFALTWQGIAFDAIVSKGAEGKSLHKAIDGVRKKKKKPPLFGLMHYELGRLIVQPLALFEEGKGPQFIQLSGEKVDRAALLKAMKF